MAKYLFFDESGNLDFSSSGSRHLCFGVLTLDDPGPLSAALTRLRYALMAEGLELERFHATDDRQAVRDRVFAVLAEVGGFEVDLLVPTSMPCTRRCGTPSSSTAATGRRSWKPRWSVCDTSTSPLP
ncbi:hypothetical protein [Longimicrobium sp.]|uniref:hypothetical protein n=1 Tax=Longimicrobium sp. TaxID=2029185 RepID=UPI002E327BAC|nr:hypothetical protein [Longimicrobium sp.]HEX6041168.1 hypothetical protein [Longimicrobium sp.]